MNLYGWGVAGCALLCSLWMILRTRAELGAGKAVLISGVSAAGGLLTARLVYWLGALDFFLERTRTVLSFFWWTDGGFSLFGAVLGAVAAAWLCCRWMKLPLKTLGALSFPVLILVAAGRLLEWTVMGMDFGALMDTPAWLTVPGEYGRQLNVALLEGMAAACVAVFLLIRGKRGGDGYARLRDTLFLIGLGEALLISMRCDNYMMWGFVSQEQLYFYLLSAGAVILKGFEYEKPIKSFFGALLAAGLLVLWEFGLDGRVAVPFAFLQDWADPFWYGLFVLTLAALIAYYFSMKRGKAKRASAARP